MQENRLTKLSDALPATPEMPTFCDDFLNRMLAREAKETKKNAKKAAKKKPPNAQKSAPKQGQVIRLPAKKTDDLIMRLEQNMGCELPVCVSNRRDVKNDSIAVIVNGNTVWELARTTKSLLPAPEHHRFWLWFLDRLHAAAAAGELDPPRVVVTAKEVVGFFGITHGGSAYENFDEAFKRFSHLVISVGTAIHTPDGVTTSACSGALGTLCSYVSWRTTEPREREMLSASGLKFQEGWIVPGPMLWANILGGYMKAIAMQSMRQLQSYVPQRLLVYLSKHCKPRGVFKIAAAKLLPRIPMEFVPDKIRSRLKPHHKALCAIGFLTKMPVFDGRGHELMITYERTRQGY